MPVRSTPIADRFPWADDVLARAIDSPDVINGSSFDFALSMADQLDRYGRATLVSQPQINWIEDIEKALEGAEL